MEFKIMDKMKSPLHFEKIVRYIPYETNTFDRRKRQSTVIVSYKDNNNVEYRKAFHNKPYTPIKDFVINNILKQK